MADKNPNTNCLEGMQCPKCASFGPFAIVVTVTSEVEMHDDGYDAVCGDSEWGNDSPCRCYNCDYRGEAGDFKETT